MSDLTEVRIREIVREEFEAMVKESLALSDRSRRAPIVYEGPYIGGVNPTTQTTEPPNIIRGGDAW